MAIQWEHLEDDVLKEHFTKFEVGLFRAKVPGGWLIMIVSTYCGGNTSVTFYPDPNHVWEGSTLP